MKLLYADCLAELGAIDPGKMVTTHSASQRVVRVKHKNLDDINSPVFLLSYLDVLVTALLSANTTRKQVNGHFETSFLIFEISFIKI